MTKNSLEQLQAENDKLRAELKDAGLDPDAIRAKVAAGLTKDQAIEVLKAQAAWDIELAKLNQPKTN